MLLQSLIQMNGKSKWNLKHFSKKCIQKTFNIIFWRMDSRVKSMFVVEWIDHNLLNCCQFTLQQTWFYSSTHTRVINLIVVQGENQAKPMKRNTRKTLHKFGELWYCPSLTFLGIAGSKIVQKTQFTTVVVVVRLSTKRNIFVWASQNRMLRNYFCINWYYSFAFLI